MFFQLFVGQRAVVRKMRNRENGILFHQSVLAQAGYEFLALRRPHVRAFLAEGEFPVGAVEGDEIGLYADLFQKNEVLFVKIARIVALHEGFPPLPDEEEKRFS